MKSVLNLSVSNQDKQKMTTIGSTTHPVTTYTKDDFLTPAAVAKKFNITTSQATEIMKKLIFKRAVFALNGHKTPIILRFGNNSTMRLHPMAFDIFQEYINNQKAK